MLFKCKSHFRINNCKLIWTVKTMIWTVLEYFAILLFQLGLNLSDEQLQGLNWETLTAICYRTNLSLSRISRNSKWNCGSEILTDCLGQANNSSHPHIHAVKVTNYKCQISKIVSLANNHSWECQNIYSLTLLQISKSQFFFFFQFGL